MTGGRRFGPTLEKAGVLSLGVIAIYAALLPLGVESAPLPAPDLVFCLVLAWVARRPAEAPLWAILALGLSADLFLSRPLGLGALALLLAAEAMRASASSLNNGPFVVEWASAAVLALAAMLGAQMALEITFMDGPGLGALLRSAASTGLAYPLVAAALAFGLGMRAARRPRDADRLGRIA